MRCTSPRTVGFKSDGKTISWSPKNYSQEYATFQLPCGKCIECRLEYARTWAIRCVHEAQMHPENSFITLTYSDEHLKSPKLQYEDFQLFMKRLRQSVPQEIGYIVTGEYGEKTKRPHWHAILFNYRPSDSKPHGSNDREDRLFTSEKLDELWGKNNHEKAPNIIGEVTLQSAGYTARYSAKKLVHGNDADHDFHPIFKSSRQYTIGKKFLEKYYLDIFNHGQLVLPDGEISSIPRYYEKWFKKTHPLEWNNYVTNVKKYRAAEAARKEEILIDLENQAKLGRSYLKPVALTRHEIRNVIVEQRFELLQKNLKL